MIDIITVVRQRYDDLYEFATENGKTWIDLKNRHNLKIGDLIALDDSIGAIRVLLVLNDKTILDKFTEFLVKKNNKPVIVQTMPKLGLWQGDLFYSMDKIKEHLKNYKG